MNFPGILDKGNSVHEHLCTGTHLPVPAALIRHLLQDGGLRRFLLKEGGVGPPTLTRYHRAAEAGTTRLNHLCERERRKPPGFQEQERTGKAQLQQAEDALCAPVLHVTRRSLETIAETPYRTGGTVSTQLQLSSKNKKAYSCPSKRLLQHFKPKKHKQAAA